MKIKRPETKKTAKGTKSHGHAHCFFMLVSGGQAVK